jgi:DNA-binding MarR family transcriptional regulator
MLLVLAGRLAQHRLEAELAPHALTIRHLGALGHLARDPGLSYSDLARRARVTAQSMHATIGQLIELDTIETVVEPSQGRRAELRVTSHGRSLLRQAAEIAMSLDEDLLAPLDRAQRRQLKQALLGFVVPPSQRDE